jgi:glyoxylase-like metal-dependent hydrolase (beta-lactamase superfamily II)
MPFDNYKGDLILLREGDTIPLGSDVLQVLFTPGHSPGHICFYCQAQQLVVSGDVLFRESIGRTDLPGGNFDTLISSIRNQLFVLPDETVIFPGHGPQTTIGYEKINNPFLTGS